MIDEYACTSVCYLADCEQGEAHGVIKSVETSEGFGRLTAKERTCSDMSSCICPHSGLEVELALKFLMIGEGILDLQT